MRDTPLLSDFQNSLIHEKSLSRLQKKIQTTALIGFIFTELEPELSHIPIVKTFATEGREMIREMMKKIPE